MQKALRVSKEINHPTSRPASGNLRPILNREILNVTLPVEQLPGI
jgi:hypothetical protein